MDRLENKRYGNFDYTSRNTGRPYYYDTKDHKDFFGLASNLLPGTPWVAHKVTDTDNLDSLALKYYNNPTLWWVIADFNRLQDPFIKLSDKFKIIKIPSISSIEFGDLR